MQAIDRDMQKLLGILFPILGVVLLLGASIEALMTHRFITLASRAEGEVVRLDAGGAHPVIQFAPAGKAVIKFSTSGYINYAVGDRVAVLYLEDAQDPSMTWAKIDTPGALWFEEIHLVGLGAAMLIAGLYNRR
ncbi:DUF3592 domain-containing protein (plasmid) [Phormidium sp. CLA17]|uniref:DUF3592 domain-containing protein n=1 Tax=Leptolyngbya sp. Cla-17 TaxID=2803751 RepID=UPI0014912AA3|nr:DUF3592 domain-containing protein [Leptolyngbya sp. Cla-17]MBM0745266.1 DUF3592 domain-containing protein [Leptolyngbya sp. Cla-17]